MKYKYIVFTQDEYNNLYFRGIYNDLKNAIPDINDWLDIYNVKIKELNEYPSTFGMCFDKEIEVDESYFVYVRGFILTDEELKPVDYESK